LKDLGGDWDNTKMEDYINRVRG